MGFSTVATAAILTIAGLIGGTAWVQADHARDASLREAQADAQAHQLALQQIDMTLVTATHSIPLQSVVIVVSNTGDAPIDAAGLDVIIDGQLVTDQITGLLIDGVGTDIWGSLGIATITVGGYGPLSTPDRVALATAEGVMVYGEVL